MLVSRGFLLILLMLGVHGLKKKNGILRRIKSEKESKVPPFFGHCDDIFKAKAFDVHIINIILEELTKHLNTGCESKYLEHVPVILAGGLYCGDGLPKVTDALLTYIQSNDERDCKKMVGFHSEYFKNHI